MRMTTHTNEVLDMGGAAEFVTGSSTLWATVGYRVFTLGEIDEFVRTGKTEGFIVGTEWLNNGITDG